MDNFYNSISLAEKLLSKNTYVTGTLRANTSRNPDITKLNLRSGDIVSKYSSGRICITNYKDKRTVLMISTEHSPAISSPMSINTKFYKNRVIGSPLHADTVTCRSQVIC